MAYHNHEEPFREVAAASLPESQPQGERVQVTPLCRCPEGVCLMHPNSPGYDKKCSLRHPVSQPSPSGDADSIEEIKGLFAMLNLGHLRAMETPNTDVIIAAAWLRSHDAKVRSDSTFTDNNGEKCCSACCKPIFDAKVGQAEHGNAELLSEIIAMLKLRLATHIKHITTDDSGKQSVQPNGYAAVLVPDWQVKQWIATFEAALQESPSD